MRREASGVQAVSPSTSHQQSQDAMTGICTPDANQSQYPLHHSDTAPALTAEHDATRGASPHNRLRPTVSLGVTYVVVCTYGYDDGSIGPTRCALIFLSPPSSPPFTNEITDMTV